ncbi:MAG: hypothetical protein B5M56_09120 [Desulfococcus sp. 4484_241]|nr:MAG: hypothetical protein B5M56_09120 [Desulfococcus sp. 4484_241]
MQREKNGAGQSPPRSFRFPSGKGGGGGDAGAEEPDTHKSIACGKISTSNTQFFYSLNINPFLIFSSINRDNISKKHCFLSQTDAR